MALTDDEVDELADRLYEAYEAKAPIAPLTDDVELTTAEAYAVQAAVFERLCPDRDDAVGHKLGLVSEAKQDQLGIPEPIFCRIAPETLLADEPVPTESMIAPRLEAEVGLLMGQDLTDSSTAADVLAATRAVVPVVEILESRYEGWAIPSAQDVIADLTSAGKVVVGERLSDVRDVDLAMESVAVSVNGAVEATGVGADVAGHPARPVAWLAGRLADFDDAIRAGDLVMTGGITAAIDIEPGDVYTVRFGSIGSIDVRAE